MRNVSRSERLPTRFEPGGVTCGGDNNARPRYLRFRESRTGAAAVTVIHDANNNKKLDFKFGFIPKEGLGWTNNPKVGMRPPSFDAAQFEVSGASITKVVRLIHR